MAAETAQIIPFIPLERVTPGHLRGLVSNASQPISEQEMRRRIAERRESLRDYLERAGKGGIK